MDSSFTVKIIVGEDTDPGSRTFFVHAELLMSRSTFFAKALKDYKPSDWKDERVASYLQDQGSQWKEGQEGVVRLPIDKPDVFANYVQLIYAGILPIFDEPEKHEEGPEDTTEDVKKQKEQQLSEAVGAAMDELYPTLTKLYIFCDKVQYISAKRVLLASFVEAATTLRRNGKFYYPDHTTATDVYANTLTSYPIREYLVDCFVYKGNPDWMHAEYACYPHEFCFDVLVGMMKKEGLLENRGIPDAKYYLSKLDELEKGKDLAGD